jgi:hypothetical protein
MLITILVGKAAGAGVRLPEQKSSAYRVKKRWHKEQGRKASWPESIAALKQPF